jgi:Zn finger protein HypA/HybF involved in hydrogenase expression
MRTDIIEKKTEILTWISEGKSKAFIIKQLDCKQDTLNHYLKIMGIEYLGNQAGTGTLKSKVKLDDIINNRVKFSRHQLKKRLIYLGLLEYKCVKCGNNGEWMGEKLSLEIDHINGINNDNRLENLRILCPNCHSQTPTFKNKNR